MLASFSFSFLNNLSQITQQLSRQLDPSWWVRCLLGLYCFTQWVAHILLYLFWGEGHFSQRHKWAPFNYSGWVTALIFIQDLMCYVDYQQTCMTELAYNKSKYNCKSTGTHLLDIWTTMGVAQSHLHPIISYSSLPPLGMFSHPCLAFPLNKSQKFKSVQNEARQPGKTSDKRRDPHPEVGESSG